MCNGGFTAAAGHDLYTARDFPKSYWNKVAFVTEPPVVWYTGVVLKQVGAGFRRWGWMEFADKRR
jgi:hypothetical protein